MAAFAGATLAPASASSNIANFPASSMDARSPIHLATSSLNGEAEGVETSIYNEVDPQILEALKSKDRLYVLKLGELMEGLILERKARVDLNPSTSYQRLLVHRCSAYYKLAPENEPLSKGIVVLPTSESRIPARRLSELVPAESTAQPAFKIMRRGAQDRARQKTHSQAGSVVGEDGDLSDVDPSESGSLGGRSNASKKRMTIEQREAAYNEARSRIFMGFEEKEKEKDLNASSSTLSLVGSTSTSAGGGSTFGDVDDSGSSPATESEWSAPISHNKKDPRRNGSGHQSAGSSSRSLRPSAPPFNANGSNSRDSRSGSPSFTYASLYEPTQSASPYDITQTPGHLPPQGYIAQYIYPLPHGAQLPPQGYMAPYQYYPPYQYQYPPPGASNSDSSMPVSGDMHPPHPIQQQQQQHAPWVGPYAWPNPHQPPPAQMQVQHPHNSSQHHQSANPPPQNMSQYAAPYLPQVYGQYPVAGYYQPSPAVQHNSLPPSHHQMLGQQGYPGDIPRSLSNTALGDGSHNGHEYGNPNVNHPSHVTSRNQSVPSTVNGAGRRGAPPARTAWSYGPGIGMGGYGYGGTAPATANGAGIIGNDVVGPRLSSMRRTSGASSTSGSTGNMTPSGDETSSIASSSTSSSSRRTYTSTSSTHPLPARPDWAVGLKPQPTLAAAHRSHDNSRTMSPARNGGQLPSNTAFQPQLASTDFPPLTSVASPPEKRTPVISGAWTNPTSMRSILLPNPGHTNVSANVFGRQTSPNSSGNANSSNSSRLEESDRGFERPTKGSMELFNPKVVRRPVGNGGKNSPAAADRDEKERQERDTARGEVVASAILVERLGSMSLTGGPGSTPLAAAGSGEVSNTQ